MFMRVQAWKCVTAFIGGTHLLSEYGESTFVEQREYSHFCLFFHLLVSSTNGKFSRFHAKLFLEAFAEVRRIVESNHVADFAYPILVFQ